MVCSEQISWRLEIVSTSRVERYVFCLSVSLFVCFFLKYQRNVFLQGAGFLATSLKDWLFLSWSFLNCAADPLCASSTQPTSYHPTGGGGQGEPMGHDAYAARCATGHRVLGLCLRSLVASAEVHATAPSYLVRLEINKIPAPQ